MEDLLKKYPALEFVKFSVNMVSLLIFGESNRNLFYKQFKDNISCIGLEPNEYETCLKWFCDTMKY